MDKELKNLEKKLLKKLKGKKKRSKEKILSKPTVKIRSLDALKAIGPANDKLVTEGETGHFKKEMIKAQKWLHK